MEASRFFTVRVPASGGAVDPTAIAYAPKGSATRVVVRNIGGAVLFLAFSSLDVVAPTGPTPETYRLPVGASDTFVLAPEQKIYAVSTGAFGLVCVSQSEAIPIEVR